MWANDSALLVDMWSFDHEVSAVEKSAPVYPDSSQGFVTQSGIDNLVWLALYSISPGSLTEFFFHQDKYTFSKNSSHGQVKPVALPFIWNWLSSPEEQLLPGTSFPSQSFIQVETRCQDRIGWDFVGQESIRFESSLPETSLVVRNSGLKIAKRQVNCSLLVDVNRIQRSFPIIGDGLNNVN